MDITVFRSIDMDSIMIILSILNCQIAYSGSGSRTGDFYNTIFDSTSRTGKGNLFINRKVLA